MRLLGASLAYSKDERVLEKRWPAEFISLCCQPSPKRRDKRPIFRITALPAFQDNHLFFATVFHLPGRWPFNHWGVALLTDHSGLPLS